RRRFVQGDFRKKVSYGYLHIPGIYGLLSQFLYLNLICKSKVFSFFFKDIQADGMKGSDLNLFQGSFISQFPLQTFPHLLGSFICKSHRCNLRWFYFSSLYKVKYLFDQSLGLSCTWSCNNRSNWLDTFHCFLLPLI